MKTISITTTLLCLFLSIYALIKGNYSASLGWGVAFILYLNIIKIENKGGK
jgi:hypothetical protein